MKTTKLLSILALALALSLMPVSALAKTDASSTLTQQGLALIKDMDEFAGNAAARKLFSSSDDISSILISLSKADYSKPTAVYSMTLSPDAAEKLAEAKLGSAKKTLDNKLLLSIPNMLNAQSGAATIAAMSGVSIQNSFVCRGLAASVLYIYAYPGDFWSMIVFIPGSGGAVAASANFIKPADTLKKAASAEAVAKWLGENLYGCEGASVVEVSK